MLLAGAAILLLFSPASSIVLLAGLLAAAYGVYTSPDLRMRLWQWLQRISTKGVRWRGGVGEAISDVAAVAIEAIERAVEDFWDPVVEATGEAVEGFAASVNELHAEKMYALTRLIEEIRDLHRDIARLSAADLHRAERHAADFYAQIFRQQQEFQQYLQIQLAVLKEALAKLEDDIKKHFLNSQIRQCSGTGEVVGKAVAAVQAEVGRVETICARAAADLRSFIRLELEKAQSSQAAYLERLVEDLAILKEAENSRTTQLTEILAGLKRCVQGQQEIARSLATTASSLSGDGSPAWQRSMDELQALRADVERLTGSIGSVEAKVSALDSEVDQLSEELSRGWVLLADNLKQALLAREEGGKVPSLSIDQGWEACHRFLVGEAPELLAELQRQDMSQVRRYMATAEALWRRVDSVEGLDYSPWVICYFKGVETYLARKMETVEGGPARQPLTLGDMEQVIGREPRRYLKDVSEWPRLRREMSAWRQHIRNSRTHKDPVGSVNEADSIRRESWRLLLGLARALKT
ncbi:MAG: hypothetical protein D9V47_01475 [Clostridia bacterium]|nr:MAG: hypothetical protein D9V47_01475 [Clostridia bacterium]